MANGSKIGVNISFPCGPHTKIRSLNTIRTTTWVTAFSDCFLADLLSDSHFLTAYVGKFHDRLDSIRDLAIQRLDQISVPYEIGNAGVFLWIDLSKWVSVIDDRGANMARKCDENSEITLTRYLMSKGVYLQPGGVSNFQVKRAYPC